MMNKLLYGILLCISLLPSLYAQQGVTDQKSQAVTPAYVDRCVEIKEKIDICNSLTWDEQCASFKGLYFEIMEDELLSPEHKQFFLLKLSIYKTLLGLYHKNKAVLQNNNSITKETHEN